MQNILSETKIEEKRTCNYISTSDEVKKYFKHNFF